MRPLRPFSSSLFGTVYHRDLSVLPRGFEDMPGYGPHDRGAERRCGLRARVRISAFAAAVGSLRECQTSWCILLEFAAGQASHSIGGGWTHWHDNTRR